MQQERGEACLGEKADRKSHRVRPAREEMCSDFQKNIPGIQPLVSPAEAKSPVASCLDRCSSPCDLPAWPLPHCLAARRIQIKSGCYPSVLRTLKGFPASLRGKGRPVRPYKHCLPTTPHGPQHWALLVQSAPAHFAVLGNQHAAPTLWTLHCLFPLPGMLFPQLSHSSFLTSFKSVLRCDCAPEDSS